MKRKRTIRPSFMIVTVGAATAVGGACTLGQDTTITNPPSYTDAATDGPSVVCPETAPTNGDPCTGTGSCTFGGYNACGQPTGPTAECVSGQWSVMVVAGGCNPPSTSGLDAATSDASDASIADAADAAD